MGLMMFGTWSFLFLSNRYPEALTLPIETGYLLVAELLTSATLVLGGYGTLSQRKWATPLILVALGELIYCTIRFAGELGQADSLPGLAFFTTVGAFGVAFAVYRVASTNNQKSIF